VKASLQKELDLEKGLEEEVTPLTRSQVDGKRTNRTLVREKALGRVAHPSSSFSSLAIQGVPHLLGRSVGSLLALRSKRWVCDAAGILSVTIVNHPERCAAIPRGCSGQV